jgi:hypothetical protein
MNPASENLSCAVLRALCLIAMSSEGGRLRAVCIASAKVAASVAWYPVETVSLALQTNQELSDRPVMAPVSSGTTISRSGPADACAIGMTPAAYMILASTNHIMGQRRMHTMSSTTLIPKCSSTIVLSPIVALDNQVNISEYGALMISVTFA